MKSHWGEWANVSQSQKLSKISLHSELEQTRDRSQKKSKSYNYVRLFKKIVVETHIHEGKWLNACAANLRDVRANS